MLPQYVRPPKPNMLGITKVRISRGWNDHDVAYSRPAPRQSIEQEKKERQVRRRHDLASVPEDADRDQIRRERERDSPQRRALRGCAQGPEQREHRERHEEIVRYEPCEIGKVERLVQESEIGRAHV